MAKRLTPDQVATLASMAREGRSDYEIARLLGIQRWTVGKRRFALGIVKPNAGYSQQARAAKAQPRRLFTEEEDRTLLRLRDREGVSWDRIRQALGRTHIKTIMQRYNSLHARQQNDGHPINCLCCRSPFFSPDRKRIRMCEECKTGEIASGIDEYSLAI